MKIRNAHGVKLSKLVPGSVVVTQFGPVVVKKVKVPKKILRDADYYAIANAGPASSVANIRVTIQLFNTVPVIGRLLDPDATIWRTDIAFGSVERILEPHQIEDLEPPFLTVEGESSGCCGCGGCGRTDAEDAIEALIEKAYDDYEKLNVPVGVRTHIFKSGDVASVIVVRNSYEFPAITLGGTPDAMWHTKPGSTEREPGSLNDAIRNMLEAHAKRPGVVPYKFNGKPWVK